MTSKIVVNNIEADSGINTITFINEVTAPTFNGNIVGTAATFSGNVDIAGALTYEDVTNVDSVGIVTARSGIHVTGGSVGIGTDNPEYQTTIAADGANAKLNIKRKTAAASNGNAFGSLFYTNSDGTDVASIRAHRESANDDAYLGFATRNTGGSISEKLRVSSDGKLTATRTSTTAYDSAATTNDSGFLLLNHGAAGHATLQFQSLSSGTAQTGQATISSFNETSGSKNTALTFGTRRNSDSTIRERLRITSAGRVGVGTDNPSRNLTVASGSSSGYIQLCNDASGIGSTDGFHLKLDSQGLIADIIHREDGPLRFWTDNTEKLRIASDGAVGIGTDNPTSDLHVFKSTSTSSIIDAAAGDALLTLRNAGNTNWSGINFTRERNTGANVTGGSIWMPSDTSNNSATLYLQTQTASANAGVAGALTDNNGVRLKLASQPGGNGTNSAFTVEVGSAERLRVTSNGRIGIGTDNPDKKVEINGAVKFTAGTSTEGSQMLVLPLEDITLAGNASASIPVGSRFTGMIIIAGYTNDTPGGVWAVASASSYSLDAVTNLILNNHPASNISNLTITSPSHGGTHQFQLNQTGSSTKTYKVFAMGIYG